MRRISIVEAADSTPGARTQRVEAPERHRAVNNRPVPAEQRDFRRSLYSWGKPRSSGEACRHQASAVAKGTITNGSNLTASSRCERRVSTPIKWKDAEERC